MLLIGSNPISGHPTDPDKLDNVWMMRKVTEQLAL